MGRTRSSEKTNCHLSLSLREIRIQQNTLIFNQLYFIAISTTVTAVITGTENGAKSAVYFLPKRAKSHTFEGEKQENREKGHARKTHFFALFLKKKSCFRPKFSPKRESSAPASKRTGHFSEQTRRPRPPAVQRRKNTAPFPEKHCFPP